MTIHPLPDPVVASGWTDAPPRMGFFTDTSICIGCKACEVACKEWNAIPARGSESGSESADVAQDFTAMSMDNSMGLGADTWRHVAFIEQRKPLAAAEPGQFHGMLHGGDPSGSDVLALAQQGSGTPPSAAEMTPTTPGPAGEFRWLMASDVCKHCTHAACLDVCPTGSLFRTEFGTVVVQEDICNGCGYCVPACPYGVIDQRPEDGRVWKCTLCYDRLSVGAEPACAKACPTDSIQFGPLDELRARADARLAAMHQNGVTDARLYGRDPDDGVGGDGAFFLLLDEPEVYGLPPDPVDTTRDLPSMWRHAAAAAVTVLAGIAATFVTGTSRGRRR